MKMIVWLSPKNISTSSVMSVPGHFPSNAQIHFPLRKKYIYVYVCVCVCTLTVKNWHKCLTQPIDRKFRQVPMPIYAVGICCILSSILKFTVASKPRSYITGSSIKNTQQEQP